MDEQDYWDPEEVFDEDDLDDFEHIERYENEDFDDYPTEQEEDDSDDLQSHIPKDQDKSSEGRYEYLLFLQKEYQRIEDDMDTGKMEKGCGEIELLGLKHKMTWLETQDEMANMGISLSEMGAVSEDYNFLIRDDPLHPEGRRIRQEFQSLPEDEQEEVLRRAIENERLTEEEAAYFLNCWR